MADITRMWCSGSMGSLDLFGKGSSPFFLQGSGRGFNPRDSLYQSGPLVQAQLLLWFGGKAGHCDWER